MAHKKQGPREIPSRIAIGEFEHKTKFPKTQIYARFKFLEIVEAHCPHVLRNLVRTVRPHYEAARGEGARAGKGPGYLLGWGMREFEQTNSTVADSLRAWGKRYFLDEEWIYPHALNSLFHWTGPRISKPTWQWGITPSAMAHSWDEIRFSFSDTGWEVTNETRADFRLRMTQAFGAHLEEYLETLSQSAIERGWTRTRESRQSAKSAKHLDRDFYYLAFWQTKRWTYSQILKHEPEWPEPLPESLSGISRAKRQPKMRGAARADEAQIVRKGILRAAKIIGLRPRVGEPGRPRKTRKP